MLAVSGLLLSTNWVVDTAAVVFQTFPYFARAS